MKGNFGIIVNKLAHSARPLAVHFKSVPVPKTDEENDVTSRTVDELIEQGSAALLKYSEALMKSEEESESSLNVIGPTALVGLCVGFVFLFAFALRCASVLLP